MPCCLSDVSISAAPSQILGDNPQGGNDFNKLPAPMDCTN